MERRLAAIFAGDYDLAESVLSQASHVVSQALRHIGFALRPAHEVAVFTRIEFIRADGSPGNPRS